MIPKGKKDLARALVASGASYREVSGALDISVGSVHSIAKEPREAVEPLLKEIKKRFALKYYLLADHVLNCIDDFNIEEAPLKDKALASAILLDKAVQMDRREAREETEKLNGLNTPPVPEAPGNKGENGEKPENF